MFVKDGDGSLVEFQWPSFWYWMKVGAAIFLGAAIASALLGIITLPLWLIMMRGMVQSIIQLH